MHEEDEEVEEGFPADGDDILDDDLDAMGDFDLDEEDPDKDR